MSLACASVNLWIGGVGRERFRPADVVRNRARLQIYNLPFQGREGGPRSHDWNVALAQNGDDGAPSEPSRSTDG